MSYSGQSTISKLFYNSSSKDNFSNDS